MIDVVDLWDHSNVQEIHHCLASRYNWLTTAFLLFRFVKVPVSLPFSAISRSKRFFETLILFSES